MERDLYVWKKENITKDLVTRVETREMWEALKRVCVRECVYIYTQMCVYVCVYIYIQRVTIGSDMRVYNTYMCIYIHTHIYSYLCIHPPTYHFATINRLLEIIGLFCKIAL